MKRMLSILLALCMLLCLTACRSSEDRRTMRQQMDLYSGKTQPELPAVLALQNGTTLDQQTVYESGGVSVTVLGIYEDEYSYRIPMTLRNDSGNSVNWGNGNSNHFSVNGYNTHMWLEGSSDVYPHGMQAATLTIDKDDIPLVITPGKISTELFLKDKKTHDSNYIPVNLTTSAGEGETRQPLSDTPFWTDGALDLYLLYAGQNSYGRMVYIFADNRSACDYYIRPQQETLSVNGIPAPDLYMSYSGFGSVDSGNQKICELSLSKYNLDDLGILPGTPLESLDFTIELTKYTSKIEESEIQLHIDVPTASDTAES